MEYIATPATTMIKQGNVIMLIVFLVWHGHSVYHCLTRRTRFECIIAFSYCLSLIRRAASTPTTAVAGKLRRPLHESDNIH